MGRREVAGVWGMLHPQASSRTSRRRNVPSKSPGAGSEYYWHLPEDWPGKIWKNLNKDFDATTRAFPTKVVGERERKHGEQRTPTDTWSNSSAVSYCVDAGVSVHTVSTCREPPPAWIGAYEDSGEEVIGVTLCVVVM